MNASELAERETLAVQRARQMLKSADRLTVEGCGDVVYKMQFRRWSGDRVQGRTKRTAHPASILTVNGNPSGFWCAD